VQHSDFLTLCEHVRLGDRTGVAQLIKLDPTLATGRGEHGRTVLFLAVEAGDPGMVRQLLRAGADRDACLDWGMNALEWSALLCMPAVAKVLLDAGAQHNLWSAAALGHETYVRTMFDPFGSYTGGEGIVFQGPDNGTAVSSDDLALMIADAFHVACRNGHLGIARFLKTLGAPLDSPGYFGATPLHWAAHRGRADVVKFLLESGASINALDPEYGGTPLAWAIESRHVPVAKYLVDHGAITSGPMGPRLNALLSV